MGDVVISGSQTNVGVSDNVLESIKVYTVVNNEVVDVTNNYVITSTPGKLQVDP